MYIEARVNYEMCNSVSTLFKVTIVLTSTYIVEFMNMSVEFMFLLSRHCFVYLNPVYSSWMSLVKTLSFSPLAQTYKFIF